MPVLVDGEVRIPDSGFTTITQADGNASATLVQQRSAGDGLIALRRLEVQSESTSAFTLQLWDDGDGTAVGNLSDQRREIEVPGGSGTREIVVDRMRRWEEDLIVEADGSQDGDVTITAEVEHVVGYVGPQV